LSTKITLPNTTVLDNELISSLVGNVGGEDSFFICPDEIGLLNIAVALKLM
jgi:hypothetical protein